MTSFRTGAWKLLFVISCVVAAGSVSFAREDCYLAIVRLISRDAAATRGLDVLVDTRKLANADVQLDLSKFLDWFPEADSAKGLLQGLDHVKDARGLDRFTREMLADNGKAASASVTLRYLKRTLPSGAAGTEFEVAIGTKSLDCRLPNGDNLETKALNWPAYNDFTVRGMFLDMKEQADVFIADAAQRGVTFAFLFDTPMPAQFEQVFGDVFGDAAAAVEFRYPGYGK